MGRSHLPLFGNNAQLWRAICWSSCEGSTSAEQRDEGIARGPAALFVEADTDPRQAAADRTAHFSVIFSHAVGKDQHVDSVERGNHRCHLLAHRTAEHLDGQSRTGVRRIRFMQMPPATADARDPEKPGGRGVGLPGRILGRSRGSAQQVPTHASATCCSLANLAGVQLVSGANGAGEAVADAWKPIRPRSRMRRPPQA
jgi:hypothetical protein